VKVLLAEDSPIMRDVIADALRSFGLEVIEAEDGARALELLDRHDDVRLVVTDLEMPHVDGFELIRRLRRRPRAVRLPAVVVSTRGRDADKLAAIEVGADAYLVKSDFTREGLWAHIARFVA
jgi:CheY-like chemotaxis protein